ILIQHARSLGICRRNQHCRHAPNSRAANRGAGPPPSYGARSTAGKLVRDAWLKSNDRLGHPVIASAASWLPQDTASRMADRDLPVFLRRIADALERLAPPAVPAADLDASDAFVWHVDRGWLEPV